MSYENHQTQPRHSLWLLLISLLLIGSGLYLLFHPATALVTSALIVGMAFILVGAGYFMEFHSNPSYLYPALGVLDMIIGVVLLANLGVTATTMPIIFGFWCLFTGISQFVGGFLMRGRLTPFGRLISLTGLIGVIFGILLFLYPLFGVFTITFLLGAYLIIYGCFELGRYVRD